MRTFLNWWNGRGPSNTVITDGDWPPGEYTSVSLKEFMTSKSETKRVPPGLNLDVAFMMKHARGDIADVQKRVDLGVAKLEAKLKLAEEALAEVESVADWCAMKHFDGHPSADSIRAELFAKGKAVRTALAELRKS
jgi:hypothetical protein